MGAAAETTSLTRRSYSTSRSFTKRRTSSVASKDSNLGTPRRKTVRKFLASARKSPSPRSPLHISAKVKKQVSPEARPIRRARPIGTGSSRSVTATAPASRSRRHREARRSSASSPQKYRLAKELSEAASPSAASEAAAPFAANSASSALLR